MEVHYYHRHIREHMKEMMDGDEDLMLDDDEAMDFHYFKIHDYDNNNKLDGLELAAALTHFHEEGHGHEGRSQSIDMEDSELESLVEGILGDDDLNKDGYIDYYEFKQAQNRKGPEAPEV